MSRQSIATPCPAPVFGSSHLPLPVADRRISTTSIASAQDDTADIEYTRAFHLGLNKAKPRRKSTFQRRERKENAVTIFEDVLEDEELVVQESRPTGGSILLGKPAQRISANTARTKPLEESQTFSLASDSHGRRRSSIVHERVLQRDETIQTCDLKIPPNISRAPDKVAGGLKKEPRRRTIFVPTEDTTILTIHPGAHTTEGLNDTFQICGLTPQFRHLEQSVIAAEAPRDQHVRRPRMSLSVAPKRVPLQAVKLRQGNIIGGDVTGKNGGKENSPPGTRMPGLDESKLPPPDSKPPRPSLAPSKLFESTAASQARQSVTVRNTVPVSARVNAPVNPVKHARLSLRPSPPRMAHVEAPGRSSMQAQHRDVPQQVRLANRRTELKAVRLQQYPILAEDVAQPELYADGWLSHQEAAFTELMNRIFVSAEPHAKEWDGTKTSLRKQMLEDYHQPQVTTLYRRLQASLLYGALSRPKDASAPPNPALDIGLRRKFLALWLESYDSEALRAAAQVVFGRQIPKSPNTSRASPNRSLDPYRNRRALIGFLETFLVQVDDVEEIEIAAVDDASARWRKMILRSLMLIWLLDRAKDLKIVRGCLFRRNSPRKSSVAMLHALTNMFIPSIGDVTRILRHLEYEVQHVQDPLDEVTYRINNIAVDLRDGLFLTKLVEVLLFTPEHMRIAESRGDATVTIQMPDFTILESALQDGKHKERARILSQHLKMPCIGRSQKCFNVQIAISALHDHGVLCEGASQVTADDIVDGHREKTLSLLWSLASVYGLQSLVDFKELILDIKRSGVGSVDSHTLPNETGGLSQSQQESLLKKWAGVYAARHGIRIGNLTTSFANGKPYAAILESFAKYTHIKPSVRATKHFEGNALAAQLHAFGCSDAFIRQLSTVNGEIPSRKTTVSNLAFLASHLLPLSRQHNAAVAIQRAFRLHRARAHVSNRIVLMRLAHACATVVQTQNRLVLAAVVLQRAWRGVVHGRSRKLDLDVQVLQTVARGWLARRKIIQERSGMIGRHSLRIMGGW